VQTQKKSCVLDLNDALLRLYVLPPKNRNEKTKNYVTNCTTNYSSKNLAVKFLLYVLEHTNLASTIKKKNTLNPIIHHSKNCSEQKNTQICTNFKTNYFLMLLLLYKKKYLCDRLKTPKMASGHYWKVQKICNWNWKIRKQKETNKQIEMVNRYHKGKHGMNVNGILWVHVVWMFVRKTEPVINLIPIMNRLDQTGSKWFICAFQGCQGLITTSFLNCLKILIFFWIPQKKTTITIKYKKN